jgi:hypothetical protein
MSNVIPFGAPAQFTVPISSRVTTFSNGIYAVIAKRPTFDEVLFRGRGAYTSDVFAAPTQIEIADGQGGVFYSVGTNPVIAEVQSFKQGAPEAFNTTGNLPVSAIMGRLVTSTTASAVTATLPTGTVLDAANSFEIDDYIDWKVINTGSNNFTVEQNTGHTIVGGTTAAGGFSNRYRTRKTAANTFVSYRI